ncbi:MAG: glycosyltransferase family 39 protein [Planctomycetota bacterium]
MTGECAVDAKPASRFGFLTERRAFWLVALACMWLTLSLPLFAQEAYYFTYSLHPDLSYFDHPPMVAWLIWVGVQVFGDGTLGIRIGMWLAGLATMWAGQALLRDFGVGPRGRTTWILANLAVPALLTIHFFSTPDPPLVAGWTLCMLALWRARSGSLLAWSLAGLFAGVALLSKYTAGFLAVSGIVLLLLDPRMRRQLLRPGPWLGVVMAAVVFSPVVIWNARHGFESFLFQTGGRLDKAAFDPMSFLKTFGMQFGLLNPVLVLLLPMILAWLWRLARTGDQRALWLLAFGLPLPVFLLSSSLWVETKPNWYSPGYVGLVLGASWWWERSEWLRARPGWQRAATVSLVVVLCILPLTEGIELIPARSGSSWTGWKEVAARAEHWEEIIDAEDGVEGNVFFFGSDHHDTAQLIHSLGILWREESDPGHFMEPILSRNTVGEMALQFDHWCNPRDLVGQDAIFVLPRPDDRQGTIDYARRFFTSMEVVERVKVHHLGIQVFVADIFACRGYRGPFPAAPGR